jgi:cytochrome c-type biogenesis protein
VSLLLAAATALWLGILTSVSPCPLASNLAAVSFVAREVGSPRRVLLGGLAYSLGRALSYVLVGALVVASVLSIPGLSRFLQERMNQVLGPLLVVIGVSLMGWLPLRLPGTGRVESLHRRAAGAGVLGAGLLGMLFALSFCPVSAGLFFGGLVPLAAGHGSRVVLPAIYGLGTGLPVVAVAVPMALGARWLGGALDRLAQVERVARPATGVVFIAAGIYIAATHLFGIAG